jgi:transposase
MASILRMPRAQRRQLVREGRRTGDPEVAVRFQIIAELGAEKSHREVAGLLHVAPSTVSRTSDRYAELGVAGLFDQRKANGLTKANEQFLDELRAVLEKTPNAYGWSRHTWTRELLCAEMERRGFERVAVGTMGRALRAIGARLGMAKPIVLCPWPAAKREARLKRLRKLAANASATEPVYYEDEVDIDLNPKIGRDWTLPGTQRLVVTPGQNEKHYVAGALNAQTRKLVWVEHHKKNSSLFCKLIWRLLQQHRHSKCVHLILDNYIIHKSDHTLRVLKSMSHRVRLHFLPPYCPDENPIERVWRDMHAAVTRNHRCKTFIELCQRVIEFLNGYDGRQAFNPSLQPRLAQAA